jgi:hypothetical protein
MAINYNVGDEIAYRTFGGGIRHVLVHNKEDDVKNGRPGFDGEMALDGSPVWGYDEQIVAIVKKGV